MDPMAFMIGIGTVTLVYGLLAAGLNIQHGYAGVLNFGYVAFFAVGAFASAIVTLPPPGSEAYVEAFARYDVAFGLPFWAGLIAAAAVAAVLALLIGATSVRLQTHYLAVATFAMAEVVRAVLINETWLTRGEYGITNVPQPGKGVIAEGAAYPGFYFLLAAAIVAIVVLGARHLTAQPFGRLLRAIRDDELAARTLGKATLSAKLKALALGGALAGLAGALWTHSLGTVHVGQFVPIITFQVWLAMLLGGTGNYLGVLLGAAVLILIREGTRFAADWPALAAITSDNPSFLPSLRFVMIGLLLILVVRYFPRGLLPEPRRHAMAAPAPAAGETSAASPGASPGASPDASAPTRTPAMARGEAETSGPLLRLDGVTKRFGGLTAVNTARFDVAPGTITGLIGPNGAGKSTAIDLISGVQRPDAGTLTFAGQAVSAQSPEAINRAGLARTFQTPRLFTRMTTWENLILAGTPGADEGMLRPLFNPRGLAANQKALSDRAHDVLARLRLAGVADTLAGELSGGQRKLLDIGRLLMTEPRLMVLDEPAAGVNRTLAREIFDLIAALRDQGLTFLIVEHDMDLILSYCDHVIVMHHGEVLAEGSPAEVRRDPAVIEAYLGGSVPSAAGEEVPA